MNAKTHAFSWSRLLINHFHRESIKALFQFSGKIPVSPRISPCISPKFPFPGKAHYCTVSERVVHDLLAQVERERNKEREQRKRAGLDTKDIDAEDEEDYMGVGPLIEKLEKKKLKDVGDLNEYEEPTDSESEDDERFSPEECRKRIDQFERKSKRHKDLLRNFTDAETLDDAFKWMKRIDKFEQKHFRLRPEYRVIGELMNRLKVADGKDKFILQQKLNRALRLVQWREAYDPNDPANFGLIQQEEGGPSADVLDRAGYRKEEEAIDRDENDDEDDEFDDMKEKDNILLEKLDAIDKKLEQKLAELDYTFGKKGKLLEEEIRDLAEERNELTEKKRKPLYRKGFDVKLIDVNRTSKVTKGGRIAGYSAILACGNYHGVIGYAKAKGPAIGVAIKKAYEKCFQNLHYVERHEDHTIAHAVQTNYKKTKVYLWPAPTRTGMKAGKTVETILNLAGFKNVKSKVVGSRNPHNTVKALFQALNAIETPRDVQEKFGRTVVEKNFHENEFSLDEILSTESEVSKPHLDRFNEGGRQQQKEAWAVHGSGDGIADHFYELVPDLALEFPFELDAFQKEAIYYLEKGESVFVAAHTSAGKTVVAEYAFALASKHCTRAVYTAPIKTISNQKYRDFCGKFDVGLLTGDVSLRPEASCLIMTTEILRSMLYRGADIIRDIEWVIFDEVHYVNDVERGVVWEEVIIMLPRHINIVLLSATVPNTVEFADWIGRTKQKKIRVTGTTKRPVPLEHCLFYSGDLYKICEGETFLPQGLIAAKDASKKKNLTAGGGSSGTRSGTSAGHDSARVQKRDNPARGKQHGGSFSGSGRGYQINGNGQNNWELRRSEVSFWLMLINKLSKKSLLPVVIFCFSKNRCDKSADSMTGTDLTSSSEKSEIRVFCDKAFSRLKGSDRNLPQVVRVQNLLRRGIGVHHAGLLPIVKEVVEMLFCRGVIKVLFSTETFAMGVNAPARTVVFDTLRKFDGKEFRQLLPGEYTQMAGRAGRRGLDKIGTVVLMCRDELPEERELKHVIVGSATHLESQFRLTYIMILHLLRVEELKVEDMLKRSFAEFHAQKRLPEMQQLLKRKLNQPTKAIECIKGEPTIEEYYETYLEAENLNNQISEAILQSPSTQQFLTLGRIIVVKSETAQDHLLGVIVKAPSANYKQYVVLVIKPYSPSPTENASSSDNLQGKNTGFNQGYFMMPKSKRSLEDEYTTSVSARKGKGAINIQLPHRGSASGVSYEVRGVDTKELLCICSRKIKIDQVGLLEDVNNSAYSKTVQLLLDLKSGGKYPPALDPRKDLKLKDMNLVVSYEKWNKLLEKMAKNPCHGCIKLEEHIKLAKEIKKHKEEVNALQFQISDEALQQMPDFQDRIDVLKEIGCIDDDLVVQMKGRVACEMNSGEELICTECLFENQLDELEPEEAVAVMSAFVFQQKNTSEPSLTPKLSKAKHGLYSTAIRLGELQKNLGLPISPEEYAQENLKFGLVEVVYEWAKGTPFADICDLTDVPEGVIVRTIVRLDETCREFKNAAAIMGNSALCKKMETASNAIKRDIVFAASLYVTGV